jgi:hypothetical protein
LCKPTFLRNVSLHNIYRPPHHRRRHPSQIHIVLSVLPSTELLWKWTLKICNAKLCYSNTNKGRNTNKCILWNSVRHCRENNFFRRLVNHNENHMSFRYVLTDINVNPTYEIQRITGRKFRRRHAFEVKGPHFRKQKYHWKRPLRRPGIWNYSTINWKKTEYGDLNWIEPTRDKIELSHFVITTNFPVTSQKRNFCWNEQHFLKNYRQEWVDEAEQ